MNDDMQARVKPQEAAREVCALLDPVREDEARVQKFFAICKQILEDASHDLSILDPEDGEENNMQAVAAALAKLRRQARVI